MGNLRVCYLLGQNELKLALSFPVSSGTRIPFGETGILPRRKMMDFRDFLIAILAVATMVLTVAVFPPAAQPQAQVSLDFRGLPKASMSDARLQYTTPEPTSILKPVRTQPPPGFDASRSREAEYLLRDWAAQEYAYLGKGQTAKVDALPYLRRLLFQPELPEGAPEQEKVLVLDDQFQLLAGVDTKTRVHIYGRTGEQGFVPCATWPIDGRGLNIVPPEVCMDP